MGLLYTHILPLRQGSHLQKTVAQSSNQLARICTNTALVSHISLAYHPNLFCHPESRLHAQRHGISVNFTQPKPRTHYLKERAFSLPQYLFVRNDTGIGNMFCYTGIYTLDQKNSSILCSTLLSSNLPFHEGVTQGNP